MPKLRPLSATEVGRKPAEIIVDQSRRYDYNLPWRGVIAGSLFYAGLSALVVLLARDVPGVVFAALMALSAVFAAFAAFMLIRRVVFLRVIELTEDAIIFPHGFPRTRISRIPYTDIIRMSGNLVVTARGHFEIGAVRFRDLASYYEARKFICSKICPRSSIEVTRLDKFEPRDRIGSSGFPDPILHWVEPADWPRYRTHLVASNPLVLRLFKALWFFVRCFGVILLPWLLLRLIQLPTMSVTGYLWHDIAVTVFFTLLYWLYSTYPVRVSDINFRAKGITVFSGKQTWDFTYAYFSGWAVVERQFGGRTLHILLLKGPTRVLEFALPDMATRNRAAELLQEKMVPHSSDLMPSWESQAHRV